MVGRIMISLKKAGGRPQGDWSLTGLSTNGQNVQSDIRFRRPRGGSHGRPNSILLDTIPGSQAATE